MSERLGQETLDGIREIKAYKAGQKNLRTYTLKANMNPSFYGKLYAQGYEIGTEESHIVAFYLRQWERLGKPAPVLEPMCGTGLKLIPFLQAGAHCDGLDASAHMLSECQGVLLQTNFPFVVPSV